MRSRNWSGALERGAKTVLVRPAPVPGFRGSRSFGLEEFDPFWQACIKAGIPVSMHASDSGYAEFLNVWEPADEYLPFKPTAFRMVAMGKRPIEDAMAALVCHGALHRNPDLRVLSIENGADWVPYLFKQFKGVYAKMPHSFPEDPVEAFKRCVYISPFWEDNFVEIAKTGGHRPGGVRLGLAASRGHGGTASGSSTTSRNCPRRTRQRSWAAT